MKTKVRRNWRPEDLRSEDFDLLARAASLPAESFLCFGKRFDVLHALGLVDEESKITKYGRMALREVRLN